MKQYGLLAAAFGGTLAVLLVAFLIIEQLGAAGATADATASPSPSAVAIARPTRASVAPGTSIAPSAPPSVAPSPTAVPTSTPVTATPTPTPTPTRLPAPSGGPNKTIKIVVPGSQYIGSVVGKAGKVTKLPSGGVLLSSARIYSDVTSVTYELPVSRIPPGTRIVRLDVAVCGSAEGDFWESYGPAGTVPTEHEVKPPDADGCWHYLGGSGSNTSVNAIIQSQSKLWIDRLVYTITTG